MANLEKYNQVFMDVFHVPETELADLKHHGIEAWDSMGHMQMIAALEEAFDIMIDIDDVIAIDSYEKGKEILKKYAVEIG